MTADAMPPAEEKALPPSRRPTEERWIVVLSVAVAVVFSGALFLALRLRSDLPTDGPRRVRLFDPAAGDYRGFALPEPFAAAPIDLATADGGRFRLADARGKAVLLFFGYTRCPDVCPQTLAKLTAALAELDDAADAVVVAFATVDPAYDTAAVVQRYLATYDPRVVGLVGSAADLAALAADYDVAFGPPPTPAPGQVPPAAHGAHAAHDDDPTAAATDVADRGHDDGPSADPGAAESPAAQDAPELAHSSTVFLIDAAGRLRVVLGAEASPADIAHDVRAVVRSTD